MWRRPKIHSGFDRAWRNNGLNERVINKLKELFVTNQIDRDNYRFYISGACVDTYNNTLIILETVIMIHKETY